MVRFQGCFPNFTDFVSPAGFVQEKLRAKAACYLDISGLATLAQDYLDLLLFCKVPVLLGFNYTPNSFSLGLLLRKQLWLDWLKRLYVPDCPAPAELTKDPVTHLILDWTSPPGFSRWPHIGRLCLQWTPAGCPGVLCRPVQHMPPCFFHMFPSALKSLLWGSYHCCSFVSLTYIWGFAGTT